MTLESIKPKMKNLFKEDILITDKVNEEPEQCISCAGSRIPESLQIHGLAEGGIKEINYW